MGFFFQQIFCSKAHQVDTAGDVNPHYLGHVMTTAQKRDMEASEDIMSRSGLKLLAKGARIDESVKERLLQHKLLKPLEDSMKVTGAVNGLDLVGTAEALLDEHPMLRELYSRANSKALIAQLRQGMVSTPFESMMTVYAEHGENKIAHAVGASLLCMGLLDKVTGGADANSLRQAMLAGLCHDIGELYIDPGFLRKGAKLQPQEWKHIAAHPIVAHRVLKDMQQVGTAVAGAVLNHHERLDGFGYPLGLQGERIALPSQVLAVSELLIGLLESRGTPLLAAEVALKLIPGEFGRPLIDAVSTLCRACKNDEASTATLMPIEQIVAKVASVARATRGMDDAGPQLQSEIQAASPAFRELMANAWARHERIRRAFSSTGLDTDNVDAVLRQVNADGDNDMLLEMTLVMREVLWRYRELNRELRVRVGRSMPDEAERIVRVLDLIDAQAYQAAEAAPA